MRAQRVVVIAGMLLLSCAAAAAQPGVVMSGGGSVLNSQYFNRANSFGWACSFGFAANRRLRLIGDFGGQHQSAPQITWNGQKATFRDYQILFGPQFTFPLRRATPYVHGLIGTAARHTTTPSGDRQHPQDVLAVNFGFATAAGGGLELRATRMFAFRVAQLDLIRAHLAPQDPQFSPVRTQFPNLGAWQNCVRLSFGIVISLGGDSSTRK